jgi:hypothetical protein
VTEKQAAPPYHMTIVMLCPKQMEPPPPFCYFHDKFTTEMDNVKTVIIDVRTIPIIKTNYMTF